MSLLRNCRHSVPLCFAHACGGGGTVEKTEWRKPERLIIHLNVTEFTFKESSQIEKTEITSMVKFTFHLLLLLFSHCLEDLGALDIDKPGHGKQEKSLFLISESS